VYVLQEDNLGLSQANNAHEFIEETRPRPPFDARSFAESADVLTWEAAVDTVDRAGLADLGLSESSNIVPYRRNIQSTLNHILDKDPDSVWVNFTIANCFAVLLERNIDATDA
jgi:hypothetical protein